MSEHSNEHIVAHAACPACGAPAGEPCESRFIGGVHAARHMVVHLPTLEELEAGRRFREGMERIARDL